MADYIVFDDIDSRDFDLFVFNGSTDTAPIRQYKEFEISGKSGVLLLDLKRYENAYNIYHVIAYEDAESNLKAFRSALLSKINYNRLEDSIHTDEFYSAVYRADFEPIITKERNMVKMDLEFERKPQRFLKSGENTVTITANGSITNPTDYPSKPFIRAYGEGSFTFGSHVTTIVSADEYTDIDSEIMVAYKGTMPKGGVVRFTNYEYPELQAGVNNIVLDGITKLEIVPRWFRL